MKFKVKINEKTKNLHSFWEKFILRLERKENGVNITKTTTVNVRYSSSDRNVVISTE